MECEALVLDLVEWLAPDPDPIPKCSRLGAPRARG
ncbi:MAG: hypothetical protein JWN71_2679 [Xanthobacteraceae bacterium]|nr:hypothetical protein [Xanthobacteraceae bacterium]